MAFTGIEPQQAWPPPDPTEHDREWTQPASPWTYDNDGPNPALLPSNSDSAQHLRARKRGASGVSAVPPYHPDYEPGQEDEYNEYNEAVDYDDGERFAEYEKGQLQRRVHHVRRGSEGYEVRPIDREQLLAEFIATRGQENGHYRRYVPEPPSEPESGGEEEEKVEVGEVDHGQDDFDEDDEEPLAVRVEKWRSGEAIS
jgi:palmitoyltransferase